MVNEKAVRTGSSWEYLLEGPRAEVEARVEELHKRYHPCGYGTYLKSSVEQAGVMRAVVWRAGSCD